MTDKFQWYKPGFLPALLFLAGSAGLMHLMRGDEYWPIHFNRLGQANGWAPAAGIPMLLIINVALFAIFFFMDEGLLELGRWNFAAPLAALNGGLGFCCLLNYHWDKTPEFKSPMPVSFPVWLWTTLFVAALVAFALNLLRRSPVPLENQSMPRLPEAMANSSKSLWVYWEHVTAKWMDAILALVVALFVAILWKAPLSRFFLALLILMGTGLLCLICIGGFRYVISRERIELRWGWARIRLLNLRLSEVSEVEVMTSGVFRRFGGFGIRYGIGTGWGFVLNNNAVCLKTVNGRRFAFSAKNPAMAAELIKNAIQTGQNERAF
jgi:hypothetical protein